MIIECKCGYKMRISKLEFNSMPWVNCPRCGKKMKKIKE